MMGKKRKKEKTRKTRLSDHNVKFYPIGVYTIASIFPGTELHINKLMEEDKKIFFIQTVSNSIKQHQEALTSPEGRNYQARLLTTRRREEKQDVLQNRMPDLREGELGRMRKTHQWHL